MYGGHDWNIVSQSTSLIFLQVQHGTEIGAIAYRPIDDLSQQCNVTES